MIKLKPLAREYSDVLDLCFSGIGLNAKKKSFEAEKHKFLARKAHYLQHAEQSILFEIQSEKMIGALDHDELCNLYNNYFRGKSKSARKVYDEIKLLGNKKCPYCGLPNSIYELDHYLPSSTHSVFSVLPQNLIPCCKDCNQGLLDFVPSSAQDEYLHPYFIEQKFIQTQWVVANVEWDCRATPNEAYTITFGTQDIDEWSATENARAQKHFELFELSGKYETEANNYIPELITRKCLFASDDVPFNTMLRDELRVSEETHSINNWKLVAIKALLACDEFCAANFS